MPPTLFWTDLTTNGANSRAGDWQYGGTAHLLQKLCGTWKSAVKTIPSSSSGVVTVVPAADPATNVTRWALAGISDVLILFCLTLKATQHIAKSRFTHFFSYGY